MRLLKFHIEPNDVSSYQVLAIERELERCGVTLIGRKRSKPFQFAARAVAKLRLSALLNPFTGEPILIVGGNVPEWRMVPRSLWNRFIPYCWDCWPPQYPRWESFFHRNRIELAFLTALQSVSYFQLRIPRCRFLWLPECIDPSEYDSSTPLAGRTIDVLELGRRSEEFHVGITEKLFQSRRVHLYERAKGAIIFPSKQEMIAGLANAKISVCFPCSMTHPERSGDAETLTYRYLESMASKCLVVGKCPKELIELFGYNPVIELEGAFQIMEILGQIQGYQYLVERNYHRLLEVGTARVRVQQLLAHVGLC